MTGPSTGDLRHELEERLAELGEFIRAQRELAQMSVRRLADLAGVSNPYLSQIERGLRRPSAEILQQLAKALKISVETLYVRAGFLSDDEAERPNVREAIGRDPLLTAEQKQALLNVYEQLPPRRAHGNPDGIGSVSSAVKRVALISLHTSPLIQPGSGDSGGMNVYVREVASALAQAGVECTTYTRAHRPGLPPEVTVEPGHRVVHVPAGAFDLPKEALADELDQFTAGVLAHLEHGPGVDVVHGNYWLSGVVGHRLKHHLDVPLVSTFHTLARVKAEGGDLEPEWRDRAEAEVIACSDAICVSCPEEERQFRRLYGDPSGRIEIVPPAVEHAFFAPGDQRGARKAVGLPVDRPVVLFVGRIQPLEGARPRDPDRRRA